jgi:hypothetical protein
VTSSIFALKNAAGDDWREKQEIEHKGGVTFHAAPLDDKL